MSCLRGLALALGALAAVAGPAAAQPASEDTLFDRTTPLSGNLELARRFLSPLTAAELPGRLTAAGKTIADQPVDLAAERFRVQVPGAPPPPAGYGVLVFIPPWEDNHAPDGWGPILADRGLIFVSAARSGNADSPLGRREPLAVLAAFNVIQRYKVDPRRVYVAGFSGGARVALRVALAYPDLFRGALLDAGADPIGGAETPLPPRDLFDRFRAGSRLVFVTGARDELHLQQEAASRVSLGRRCVAGVVSHPVGGLSHEPAPPSDLAEALTALEAPPGPPSPKAQACWTKLTGEVDAALDAARTRGDLERINHRYGGLAAPRILDLSARLAAPAQE
ncbi:PHB depolymerase family esterase [Phenylobacterium sp.]|uniref:alpha/beta hydrolase family protein n=1 Tax=Phenylobacterium sp. TaxID=1871053 RepID=UPI0011FEF78D|nr:PHB depolymerase family esterase [Phenylobacterium sp.]THD64279.1 MAG: hypothetical protein E8A49_01950 [Phenylobacterium sp.]